MVREATAADREAVIGIVSEMWQEVVTSRYDWLYANNPHGRALTWLVVERGAEAVPVAITSVFPRHVIVGGRDYIGSIGGDCYVVPRARRKGLATKLHTTCLSRMSAGGVDFMYGPPRANNLQALLKAGSHDVAMFRRWTRPLTIAGTLGGLARYALAVFDRMTRPRGGVHWALEPIAAFSPEIVRSVEAASRSSRVTLVRDGAWLTWRYLRGPSRKQIPYAVKRGGELVGLVVLEAHDRRGVVVDVAVPDDRESLDATVELLLAEARRLGCDVLDASFTDGAPIVPALRRRAFVGREGHGFQVALGTDDATLRATTLDAKAWAFCDGDKDIDTVFSLDPSD